jgi:hypothetical protein
MLHKYFHQETIDFGGYSNFFLGNQKVRGALMPRSSKNGLRAPKQVIKFFKFVMTFFRGKTVFFNISQ